MSPAVSAPLRRHAEAIEAFIQRARRMPPARASQPRAPGKWTPLQEAAHLTLTCEEFRGVLAGGPGFALLVPPEKADHYQRTVLPRILTQQWFPQGATAPNRTRPDDPAPTMESALRELEAAAAALQIACEAAAESQPDRAWTHPYFGPMPLSDLLEVLTAHIHHHARFLPDIEDP